jgi:hypothetical protein
MTLSTAHIGIAIKDFLEGKQIVSEPANREDPYGEEYAFIESIDVSDPHNPWIHTDQGTFKIIILKMDPPVKLTRITEEGT